MGFYNFFEIFTLGGLGFCIYVCWPAKLKKKTTKQQDKDLVDSLWKLGFF